MKFPCLIVALGWIGVFWSPAAAQERFRVPTSVSSKVLGFALLWGADKRGFLRVKISRLTSR